MKETKVVKFGGSSLADANQFKKVADIVLADSTRRFVVASAPGKRFVEDIKVTDMLYQCYELATDGQEFDEQFQAIKERYNTIIADLGIEDFSLEDEFDFLNGASLSFFAMGAFHMAIYARQSKSRPHYLFTICLIWMALIELKEFFLSHDAAYNYEILGPGFTFPDLFTLALLSLFFFELVMPGRITARYSLKLLSPFVLLGGAYWLGTAFEPRTVYASLPELLKDLPSFLPTVILLYTLYTVGYCLFALTRIVLYSIRYSREIAQAYSFTERIHLQWLRWMSALLAFYLLSYIIIILFFSNIWFTILIYILTLTVWGILYGCILQYRIPDIIRDYWQPLPEGEPIEENPEINLAEGKGRAASLREQLQEAIVQRKLYLNPGLTIIDLACECGTNRTQLSLLLNKELGLSFRDYINHCRIQYAALPLLEDEEAGHKIEEVALLSGFGSTATFYRAFAKEKGMAPQQWQESIRKSRTRGGEDYGLREITGLQEECP
mgnify:CR=1 FL=1